MPLTRNAAYNIAERIANVLPLADATVVYQHAALGLSSGRVRPLQSGDTFAGFAGRRVDSRALATGAPPEQVPIIRSGEALLPITASVGASVYATADDTFSTAGGSYIGKVVRLEGAGSWVAFEAQSGGAVPGDGNLAAVADAALPGRRLGDLLAQPLAIAKPVTAWGKLACRFGAGQWSTVAGAPTLTQGYTGWDGSGAKTGIVSRTGMPDMLRVVPAGNGVEQISLGTFGTNMLTPALGGKFGLWVYVDRPEAANIDIGVEISTGGAGINCLYVVFTPDQIRHGWNFLKFVMRDPAAYVDGTGVSEDHPHGIQAVNYGSGVNANIKDNPAAALRIQWRNAAGCTIYFDSMWTAFETKPGIVMGCDGGIAFESFARPIFDAYAWVGYLAYPIQVAGSHGVIADPGPLTTPYSSGLLQRTHAAGWDIINHTANHIPVGTLTVEGQIAYELQAARDWQVSLGCTRGMEFYASPQTSTSRLAEDVISQIGFVAQRHAKHHNITPTPWGIDNPRSIGSWDMGSNASPCVSRTTAGAVANISGLQRFTKLKAAYDANKAYGDTTFPFWHGVTAVGDTGTGEDLTGDNLLLTRSAFQMFCDYVRQDELAGNVTVHRGFTGWWYGSEA